MKKTKEVQLYKSGIRTKATQRPEVGPDYTIQHPAGHAAGPNMTEKQSHGHRRYGHLDHHVPQVSKHKDYPDGTPMIDYTQRKASTSGKYDPNTDGPYMHDSEVAGWNVDGDTLAKSKPVGLANNKVRAMVLNPFPQEGKEDDQHHVNMGSKVDVLHDCIIDTVHGYTHEYKPYERF